MALHPNIRRNGHSQTNYGLNNSMRYNRTAAMSTLYVHTTAHHGCSQRCQYFIAGLRVTQQLQFCAKLREKAILELVVSVDYAVCLSTLCICHPRVHAREHIPACMHISFKGICFKAAYLDKAKYVLLAAGQPATYSSGMLVA